MTVEGSEKLISVLGRLQERFLAKAKTIIDLNARALQRYVKTEKLTGGTTETRLKVRSGRLRGSVIPIPTEIKEDRVEGGISFGTIYARPHVGPKGQVTTIVPKRGKYLTIPLPAALQGGKGGSGRGSAREGPWGETFIAKSKAGNLIMFGKLTYQKGPRMGQLRSKVVPLFLLKKQVKIKSRVFPEDLIAWIKPKVIEDFAKKGIEVK